MRGPVSFDRVADRYDATRGGEERGAHFAAQIHPWLVVGSTLEVGVGTGVVAAALAARGEAVVGMDISAEMLHRAYGRLGPRVARGDARRLPVRPASVSNVVFVRALHLCGDVPAAFAEAARALRPGGRVVAVHGVPDLDRALSEASGGDVVRALARLEHLRIARPDGLEAVCTAAARAGLGIIAATSMRPDPAVASPNAIADQIAQRVWSYLWHVDEEAWRASVVPVVAALRALPEPDRPRTWTLRGHHLSVFER
jgi:SAM-dependent methyltransferase